MTDDKQIIYVLENEAMPGIIKIGRTSKDVKERVAELSNSTAVPYPFRCVYAATVHDAVLVERQIHSAFAAQRIRKEFFKLPAHCVISVLELVARSIVTPAMGVSIDVDALLEKTSASRKVVRLRQSRGPSRAPRDGLSSEPARRAPIAALAQVNRPVSNDGLAALLRVSKAESSRRVRDLGSALKKERIGRYGAISIPAPTLVPAEASAVPELVVDHKNKG